MGRSKHGAIYLPVGNSPVAPLAIASSAGQSAAPRGRILVIDDDPLIGSVVRNVLSTEHDVFIVDHASAAVARTIGERERLGTLWGGFVANLQVLLGHHQVNNVEVGHDEYVAVLKAIDENVAREEIAWRIRGWQFEPAEKSLIRVSEQARAIAQRLGKPVPEVVIESNGLRLLPERWAEFWSAFVHVVRNALDHGIESADERRQAAKSPQGRLYLATRFTNDDLVVEIADDGRGMAFDLLRDQAIKAGLAQAAPEDLIKAVFHDGLTTKREVSEFSGRGIGMGAVKAVCERMGGRVVVQSVAGQGTVVRFVWSGVDQNIDPMVLGPVAATKNAGADGGDDAGSAAVPTPPRISAPRQRA